MKKFISFVLILVLLSSMSLVACDDTGSPSNTTSPNGTGTGGTNDQNDTLKFPDTPSQGFKISQIDGNTCAVIGIGTCTDTMIRIPSEIGGMKVTEVYGGHDWKRSSGEPIKGMMFPDSVTKIASYERYDAFSNALAKIVLPDTPILIEERVFEGTAFWANSANWTDGALYIGKHLISVNYKGEGNFAVREGTLDIASHAFYESAISHVVIPHSVVNIGDEAFMHCEKLNRITLGKGVKYIGEGALHNCDALRTIAYAGSEAEWNSIKKTGMRSGSTPIDYEVLFNWTDMDTGNDIVVGTTDPKYFIFTLNPDNASYKVKANPDYIGMVSEFHIPAEYEGLPVTAVGAFGGVDTVKTITMPDTVTSIDYLAFGTSPNLERIKLSSSLSVLPEKMCAGCEKLNYVVIPASVTLIKEDAFSSCMSLDNIKYDGTLEQWAEVHRDMWWYSGSVDYTPAKYVICKDGNGPIYSKRVTDGEWNSLIEHDKLKNFTLNVFADFYEGWEADPSEFEGEIKIAGDLIKVYEELFMQTKDVSAYKNLYLSCITELVDDFSKFEYDGKTALYVSKAPISYGISFTYPGDNASLEAQITASNVKVELDDMKWHITKITADMTQVITYGGDPYATLRMNVVLTLSDYGETNMQ